MIPLRDNFLNTSIVEAEDRKHSVKTRLNDKNSYHIDMILFSLQQAQPRRYFAAMAGAKPLYVYNMLTSLTQGSNKFSSLCRSTAFSNPRECFT